MINTLPCPAWVFSLESNTHRAKDRSWFGDDYQTINSALSLQRRSSDSLQLEVIGIGTVELPVKRHPDARGAQSHGVLRLRNVLHVPSGLCNVVAERALLADYAVRRGPGGIREISHKNGGGAVAYLHQLNARLGRHLQVRLSGPPIGPRLGPSPFIKGESYSFGACWHDDAREQVMRTLAKSKPAMVKSKPAVNSSKPVVAKSKPAAVAKKPAHSPAVAGAAATADPPLAFTDEEREWMRTHHGSVYLFLRVCGLKGSSAEDAQAARRVIRMRMAGGSPHGSGSASVVVAEAERCFGREELAWVRERYGDGLSFMIEVVELPRLSHPTPLTPVGLTPYLDSRAQQPFFQSTYISSICSGHYYRSHQIARVSRYQIRVIGIGTVRLPVKISPDPGNREHGIVTLRNVLHAPDSLCNIIGFPFHNDYNLFIPFSRPVKEFYLPDGTPAGFFKKEIFLQLRLSGPPIGPRVGPSPFEPECTYWLRGDWPDAERDKWLLPKARQVLDRPSVEERKWLKKHYGNEYKFLAAHSLRIRDERDRQSGLKMMRVFMRPDGADYVGGWYEEDPVTPDERKWLKKHYGNEYKFLNMHGLKLQFPQDRQLGLRIVRAMMEKDA